MFDFDTYKITSHSSLYVLSKLSSSKIKIKNFTIIDKYLYSFQSSIFNRKRIRKIFPSIVLIDTKGILSLVLKGWKNKIVLLSIVISCFFYSYLSSPVVEGDGIIFSTLNTIFFPLFFNLSYF